jgi:hypothetical protein
MVETARRSPTMGGSFADWDCELGGMRMAIGRPSASLTTSSAGVSRVTLQAVNTMLSDDKNKRLLMERGMGLTRSKISDRET